MDKKYNDLVYDVLDSLSILTYDNRTPKNLIPALEKIAMNFSAIVQALIENGAIEDPYVTIDKCIQKLLKEYNDNSQNNIN
jgi:hypothetical protein